MLRLIFMRHGEPRTQNDPLTRQEKKGPLTETGKDQVRSSTRILLSRLKQVDLSRTPAWIFTSPTVRTVDTAYAVRGEIGEHKTHRPFQLPSLDHFGEHGASQPTLKDVFKDVARYSIAAQSPVLLITHQPNMADYLSSLFKRDVPLDSLGHAAAALVPMNGRTWQNPGEPQNVSARLTIITPLSLVL